MSGNIIFNIWYPIKWNWHTNLAFSLHFYYMYFVIYFIYLCAPACACQITPVESENSLNILLSWTWTSSSLPFLIPSCLPPFFLCLSLSSFLAPSLVPPLSPSLPSSFHYFLSVSAGRWCLESGSSTDQDCAFSSIRTDMRRLSAVFSFSGTRVKLWF